MSKLSKLNRFVKICGVTSPRDAQLAIDAGSTAIGIILSRSPRQVAVSVAKEITDLVGHQLVRVGVFRNSDDDFVLRAVQESHFDVVQIHGPLSERLRGQLSARDVEIIKALAIDSLEFNDFDDSLVDAVLIDGPVPGSGATHSWTTLHNRTWSRPLIAAGGLTSQNVETVLADTRAWGCDVATGVETTPGVKSSTKVHEFVSAAHHHFDQREEPYG